MELISDILAKTPSFEFELGGLIIEPTYIQAGLIVFLLFLLVLSLARLRRMYVKWSFTGAYAWMFMGFLITLILEGFLLLSGRTFLTEVLGWKSAPKPIQTALDTGRNKFVDVLGVSDETPTTETLISDYRLLSEEEAQTIQASICAEEE